jgi:hypothetical protein
MSTLDEITKEKQRVRLALVRLDVQREKLTSQFSELEVTQRVLARYNKGAVVKKVTRVKTPTTATKADATTRSSRRSRATAAKPPGREPTFPSLGDRILALANGKTQQELTAACKGVRPNHVGVVIARHKRAGRIEERDGRLYATQSLKGAMPTKLDIVVAIANPLLQSYHPTRDPNRTMADRGFMLFDMAAALRDISQALEDPTKTLDDNAYIFAFDQAFVLNALGLNEYSLDAAINGNTTR